MQYAYIQWLAVIVLRPCIDQHFDFSYQIGEWLVEMIYEGKRATSGIQKGWDVDGKGKHLLVKA